MDPTSSSPGESQRQRWAPCQPGELQRMAAQIRSDRRARLVNRATLVGVVLAVAVLGAAYAWNSMAHTPRAIFCTEVIENLPAYAAGELDPELKARIDYHLSYCYSCRNRYREFGQVSAAHRPALPLADVLSGAGR